MSEWSRTWIDRGGLSLRGYGGYPGDPGEGREEDWRRCGPAFVLVEQDGPDRALGAVLDSDLASQPINPQDRRVLDGLWQSLSNDLVKRLRAALEWDDATPADWSRGHARLAIGDHMGDIFKVALPLAQFASLGRQACANPPRPSPPPEAAATLVGKLPVQLEAILGRSTISLSDLAGLAVGDVLLLSTGLDQPAVLALPGGAPLVHARRIDDAGASALEVA